MFKDVMKFFKDDNAKWFFVIVVVLLIIWSLMSYSDSKGKVLDTMTAGNIVKPFKPATLSGQEEVATVSDFKQPVVQNVPGANTCSGGSGYDLAPVANPKDLLPQDQNSQWATLNPMSNDQPILPDLLQAGNLIGLDTIGQTLKNANQQLRSDPVITKSNVGPWNNSTYEADLGRVPLEIGCAVPN